MKKIAALLCVLMIIGGCSNTDEVVTPSPSVESTPMVTPSSPTPSPTEDTSIFTEEQLNQAMDVTYTEYTIVGSGINYWVLDPLPDNVYVMVTQDKDHGGFTIRAYYDVDESLQANDALINNPVTFYPLDYFNQQVEADETFLMYGNTVIGKTNDFVAVESVQMGGFAIPQVSETDGSIEYNQNLAIEMTQIPLVVYNLEEMEGY